MLSRREASPYDISIRGVSLLKVRVLYDAFSCLFTDLLTSIDSTPQSKARTISTSVCFMGKLIRSFATNLECESIVYI